MINRIGNDGLLSDDTRNLACFEENWREYRVSNPISRRLLRYRIDGGVIKTGERCDFALGVPSFSLVCLIELKGMDLKKAARQLLATIQALKTILQPYVIHIRIVLSRISRPDLRSSDLIRLEREILKKGGTVYRASRIMNEDIENMNPQTA